MAHAAHLVHFIVRQFKLFPPAIAAIHTRRWTPRFGVIPVRRRSTWKVFLRNQSLLSARLSYSTENMGSVPGIIGEVQLHETLLLAQLLEKE